MGEILASQKADAKFALLYQNDEYGRGIRGTFLSSFTRIGGSVVTDDPYALDLPSFEPYLQRLRGRGGADVLVIGGTAAAMGTNVIATWPPTTSVTAGAAPL